MIGIIDYGMGNLRSVQKAFESINVEAIVSGQPNELANVDRLILPGVGAFADGMTHLRERELDKVVTAFVETGKPFLGICLGMQLVFEGSEEDAPADGTLVPGLGILKGSVVRFRGEAYGPGKLKVPHMGWNALTIEGEQALFAGLPQGASVYFVHSYYASPADPSVVAATAEHGKVFCAAVHKDNVWATQFHPEKSQRIGMKMLENFAKL